MADLAVVCLSFSPLKKCALVARAFLFVKNTSPNIQLNFFFPEDMKL